MIEKDYDIDLDILVRNDDEVYRFLIRLRNRGDKQHGVFQNTLRKYYEFCSDHPLPIINEYERRMRSRQP